MPNTNGLLAVLSGPAGSGKTTLAERLIRNDPKIRRAVTATTRQPRPGEQDGVDYYFLSREEFQRRIANDEFLEYTVFNGNYYGTPHKELDESLARGGVVLLVIEVDGAESIKFFYPEAVFIFIIPPTPQILKERLIGRGTESAKDVEGRLAIARREMQRIGEYDFMVINADPFMATLDIAAILRVVRRSRITSGEEVKWDEGYYAAWQSEEHAGVEKGKS